jgi:rRNA maturation endonuclease Nob1
MVETTSTYECVGCRIRVETDSQPARCDICGAEMRNISKPRGQ